MASRGDGVLDCGFFNGGDLHRRPSVLCRPCPTNSPTVISMPATAARPASAAMPRRKNREFAIRVRCSSAVRCASFSFG